MTVGMVEAALDHHQAGRHAQALNGYRAALAGDPANADALHLSGVLALQAEDGEGAARIIGRAVRIRPGAAAYHSNLAYALRIAGRGRDALRHGKSALVLRPDQRDALNNLGQILQDDKVGYSAILCFARALVIDPRFPEASNNLGNEYRARWNVPAAMEHYRYAVTLRPDYPEAHNNMAVLFSQQGVPREAEKSARTALISRPDYVDAWNNLGNCLRELGRLDQAERGYDRALAVRPHYAEALNNLGNVYKDLGRLDDALVCFQRALDTVRSAEFMNNVAGALMSRGQIGAAIASFGEAAELDPSSLDAVSNLIMSLHYSERHDLADILRAATQFDRAVVDHGRPAPVFANSRDPARRLRIGYVSADFKTHPVSYFLIRCLENRDVAGAEIFCYSNSSACDAVTLRLQAACDHWRSLVGLDDRQAADLIAADAIDILVDLSGHTGDNRLALFGKRAAPVQASWIGYFGTTGLSAMDYVIADEIVLPEADDQWYSETPWRLPGCYLCYEPHGLEVQTAPFPALASGQVTFGCLNNVAKISAGTIACWAEILGRVAGSRLLLKSRSFATPRTREIFLARFAEHGIGADRLVLEPHSPLPEAMARYNDIDIALDPFPFGGGTTTAETLWMGVPLVTLRGSRWSGRMSASILATVGLDDWVAEDRRHYVEIAVRAAADLAGLRDLRHGLRGRLEASSFCDGPAFARKLDDAYRGMWKAWCDGTRKRTV